MDFAEALSLGALIAAYTRQGFDINIALSAIGLYWKLADYTLITAREAQPGDRPEIVRKMRQEIITTIAPTGTLSIIAGCSSGVEPAWTMWAEVRAIES